MIRSSRLLDDLQQMADTTRQTAADHERRIAEYEQTIVQADAQRTQLEQASEQSGLRTGSAARAAAGVRTKPHAAGEK